MLPVEERQEWIKSRRNKRKQARSARLRREFFRYLVLTSLCAAGLAGFLRLPWSIKDEATQVNLHGNLVATDEQIREKLGEVAGIPIFNLDPKKLERKIEELPAVKKAFVRRYNFPKPLVAVEVLEEFPWATLSTDPDEEPLAVIAQSGRLVPISDFPRMIQPGLRIYGAPELKITGHDVQQWATWLNYISDQTGCPVEALDLRRPGDIRVLDGDLYLKIGAADSSLTRRLGRLNSILSVVQARRDKLEYVDLALDNTIPLKIAKKADSSHSM